MTYSCGTCKCEDCKLWRPANVFLEDVKLICYTCLEDMGYNLPSQYGDQVYDSEISYENWVPAVPDLKDSYWGYTSVPNWWCEWWKVLPDTKFDCTICCGKKFYPVRGKLSDMECASCDGSGKRDHHS